MIVRYYAIDKQRVDNIIEKLKYTNKFATFQNISTNIVYHQILAKHRTKLAVNLEKPEDKGIVIEELEKHGHKLTEETRYSDSLVLLFRKSI